MKFETACLHAGYSPDPATNSRAVPVYRTSSFVFRSTEHAARLFALQETGNIYSRIMNPTHDVLEQRIAALEGGVGALALASGTSAVFYSLINFLRAGDEVVSASGLYGGTYTQFHDLLPQFGIKVRFVDASRPRNFAESAGPRTKAFFCETVSNPGLEISDIAAISGIAHELGVPLIVDSTFTTPAILKPIEYGADIVVHSLTKWIGGHGAGIGGIVVDAGKFDWRSERFPLLNEPDNSYHGLRWAHDLGELSTMAYILRMRTVPLRNLGACISPDNAWMFIQGLETLPLRMERHCANALATAQFLKSHPAVTWVRYPGLLDDPEFSRAQTYLKGTGGGMVVFGIRGGLESGRRFIDSLSLFSHLANVGDARSLAIHPASTTHSQLTVEQQRDAGIVPEMVRLSIGLEHIDDILQDLSEALSTAS